MSTEPLDMINEDALTAAHVAIEDVLCELRDSRISVMGPANGFIVRERNGELSPIMRIGTRDGLRIAIAAYLNAIDALRESNGPVGSSSPVGGEQTETATQMCGGCGSRARQTIGVPCGVCGLHP